MKPPDTDDPRVLALLGIGVIGGLFLGKEAVTHLFVDGMTAEERKGMLIFGGSIIGLWAATELAGIPARWISLGPWLEDPQKEFDAAQKDLP